MSEYLVLIEKGPNDANCGAWVPDLPGCVSTGNTPEEAENNIREAIEGHLRCMQESGELIPQPSPSLVKHVKVA